MRQLAKSALSLGWALSLLGAKQAYGVVTTGQFDQGDVLGPVTQAAVGQLDESMRRFHRSADNMESRVVDLAFSFMNPARWLNPESWKAANPMASWSQDAGASEESDAQTEEPRSSSSNM